MPASRRSESSAVASSSARSASDQPDLGVPQALHRRGRRRQRTPQVVPDRQQQRLAQPVGRLEPLGGLGRAREPVAFEQARGLRRERPQDELIGRPQRPPRQGEPLAGAGVHADVGQRGRRRRLRADRPQHQPRALAGVAPAEQRRRRHAEGRPRLLEHRRQRLRPLQGRVGQGGQRARLRGRPRRLGRLPRRPVHDRAHDDADPDEEAHREHVVGLADREAVVGRDKEVVQQRRPDQRAHERRDEPADQGREHHRQQQREGGRGQPQPVAVQLGRERHGRRQPDAERQPGRHLPRRTPRRAAARRPGRLSRRPQRPSDVRRTAHAGTLAPRIATLTGSMRAAARSMRNPNARRPTFDDVRNGFIAT